MRNQFESHSLLFMIEGDGFVRSHLRSETYPDFVTICERIKKKLDETPAAEVARLHAAAMVTTDGPEAIALDDIANHLKAEVTHGWHNPNGAIVNLIPIPGH